jgi:hypothetical protein
VLVGGATELLLHAAAAIIASATASRCEFMFVLLGRSMCKPS